MSALPVSVPCWVVMWGPGPCPCMPEASPLPTKRTTSTHTELSSTPSIQEGCGRGAMMGCRTTSLAANLSSLPHGHGAQGKAVVSCNGDYPRRWVWANPAVSASDGK